MKRIYSSMKTGGYLLAFFLLFGIVFTVASSTAQAQYRDHDRYRNDRYRNDRYRNDRNRNDRNRNDRNRNDRYGDRSRRNALQVARQQGYSYGLNVGAADGQRGQSFNPQRSRYYRNGMDGYSSSYGNRGLYRQVFRDAFIQGYREGYQRYARRDRRWDNRRRW